MGRPSRDEPPRTDAILAAALDVFLSEGYGASSVDAIVQKAGVSKATLYRHFANKDALLRAVLQSSASDAWGRGRRPGEELKGAPREALHAFGAALLAALRRPLSVRFFRLVIAEAERFPALSRSFYEALTAPTVGALAAWLAERHAAGALRVPDPELAALQFLGLFKETLFWPRIMGAHRLERAPDAVLARAVDVFLAAHAPQPSERTRSTEEPSRRAARAR